MQAQKCKNISFIFSYLEKPFTFGPNRAKLLKTLGVEKFNKDLFGRNLPLFCSFSDRICHFSIKISR